MEGIALTIVICLVALTQTRPQPPANYVLWNYFPFVQTQHLQMLQQANMPIIHPVNIPRQQYPTFEMFFKRHVGNNMPIIGEVQFHIPVQPTTTRRPPTTTTPLPKQRASVRHSTPLVADSLKAQLSKGIFEMARKIQANILSNENHQQTGKFNVFSPINVASVLSLLELGAKGQTNRELQHILGFDRLDSSGRPLDHHYALGQMLESILYPETSTEGGAQINMANGIFMQTGYSMRPEYRTSVETIYQSQVTALDFQQRPAVATKFINDWVQHQTNGKIGDILVDGTDKSTRMMVASAMYFKALWVSSFIPEATSKRPFYPNGKEGQKIMVDTMGNGGNFKYYKSKEYDCGIIALPFKGQTTTMYIILPNKSNVQKLRKLQAALTSDIIDDMICKMKKHRTLVTLPKMHLTDTLNLKDVLGDLNIHNVFGGESSDFSGITKENQISLDGYVHKVELTLNETGTEAAAATVLHITRQDFEIEFRVDSPFMFVVRDDTTKLPLFYGSVKEPVSQSP